MSTETLSGATGGTQVRVAPVDATPLPRQDTTPLRLAASQVVLLGAGLVAWLFLFVYVLSGFSQGHAQQQLYGRLRSQLAEGTAPQGAPIAAGAPVALIDAPGLGLRHVVVVEGTRPAQLEDGPGHAVGSVLPGQAGTSVLMGRAISYGAPFGHLGDATQGESISVTTGEGAFRYRVDDVRRPGDPVPPAVSNGGGRLTLVSAGGSGALAPGRTVYLDATLQGSAQPAGPVAAPDPAGAPMAHDTSAGTLAILALLLQALALVLAGLVWARHRWSPMGAWIAGAPVLVAVLWGVSLTASRLLPNLL